MTAHRKLLVLMLMPAALGIALQRGSRAQNATADQAADIIVVMEDCKASRPGQITSETSILRLILAGPPKEELVKRGTVEVDQQKYILYLPKATSYSLKNTKPS